MHHISSAVVQLTRSAAQARFGSLPADVTSQDRDRNNSGWRWTSGGQAAVGLDWRHQQTLSTDEKGVIARCMGRSVKTRNAQVLTALLSHDRNRRHAQFCQLLVQTWT